MASETRNIRTLEFVGSSREDLRAMPKEVSRAIGLALSRAQRGEKATSAKPLKGYRGAGVLEIVEDYDSDTYRAVYTVLALVERRLRAAEKHYADNHSQGE